MARRKRSKAGGGPTPGPRPEVEPASAKQALDKLKNKWRGAKGRQGEQDAAFDHTVAFVAKYKSPNVVDMLAAEDCLMKVAWRAFVDTLAPKRRWAALERRHDSTLLMCQLIPAGARLKGSRVWDFYTNGPSGPGMTKMTKESTLCEFLRAVQEELFAPGKPMEIDAVRMFACLFGYVQLGPVRHCIKPFVDCALWQALPVPVRNALIAQDEFYARSWANVESRERPKPDPSNVIAAIVAQLMTLSLRATTDDADIDMLTAILDLMSLLLKNFAMRQFVEPLVVASGTGAAVAALAERLSPARQDVAQQVEQFLAELRTPVDGVTGQEMEFDERQQRHAADVVRLQQECAQLAAPSLEKIAYATVDQIGAPNTFAAMIEGVVQAGELPQLLKAAKLDSLNTWAVENDAQFALPWPRIVAAHYQTPEPLPALRGPLPDADALFSGPPALVTPRNLFLSLHDWARHLSTLAELETADELLRQLAEALLRLDVQADGTAGGWARDAVLLGANFAPVAGPEARVMQADVTIDLAPFPESVRTEWRALKPLDRFCVVVLAGRDSNAARSKRPRSLETVDDALKSPSAIRNDYGIHAVLSAHLLAMVDNDSNVGGAAQFLTLRLQITGSAPEKPLHAVLLRLRPAVTEAVARTADIQMILDAANHGRFQLPQWCQAAMLGYGDPPGASAKDFGRPTVYLGDTRAGKVDNDLRVAVIAYNNGIFTGRRTLRRLKASDLGDSAVLPRRYNYLRFEDGQLDAIIAGCAPGLSVVDGCNGSGKTVATAQIVANLYHSPLASAPRGPTALIVSTEAYLGRVLARVFTLGVRPWHVARPGTNMQLQATVKERERLLGLVAQIAARLQVPETFAESAAAACEFFRLTVQPRWAAFEREAASADTAQNVWAAYPFPTLQEEAVVGEVGQDESAARARKSVKRLYRSIAAVFADLETLKLLEELQDPQDQAKALLQRAAKIVVGRSAAEILAGGGARPFSSVIVLGAAQLRMTKVLPAIAMPSVERICLLGTDEMVCPAVSSRRLWDLGARESLFGHLVGLGVPVVRMNWNRRCEAGPMWQTYATSATDLYNADVDPSDYSEDMVPPANAGFMCVAQAVQVPGLGETRVGPGRVVRSVEADYVVGVFQYMRLIGYDADQVAIVCMTDAQVDLVRDEVAKRCGGDPNYGWPAAIVTPFTAAGVECEIVLVSLVYTLTVPDMLADPRVMLSAVSRASHGAYIFGELALFSRDLTSHLDWRAPTDALYLCGNELADGSVRRHARNIGLVRLCDESWVIDEGPNMPLMYKIESAEHMRAHVAQMVAERAGVRVGAWVGEM